MHGGLGEGEESYYADGAWYDAEYVHIGGDIPYYQRVARETEGPILELACGTGRLSIPMAQTGRPVLGIDIAPGMLERAQEKRSKLPPPLQDKLHFELGDMRTLRLGRTFNAVVLAFNTLLHMLEDDDLLAALETARIHLAPGGLFHLDVHTPYPTAEQRREPDGRYDPQQMIDPRTGQRYIVSENNRFDPRTQINSMSFYYRPVNAAGEPIGPEREVVLRLRVLFPRELDSWIRRAGLEVAGDWDDFNRARPFTALGGRRVMALRAAAPRSAG